MRGRPRLTDSQAEANGSKLVNPQRYRDDEARPRKHRGLGDAPEGLGIGETIIWYELLRNFPHLEITDRFFVEQLCELIVRRRTSVLESKDHSLLLRMLTQIGGTPASRRHMPEDPNSGNDDDFDKLMN